MSLVAFLLLAAAPDQYDAPTVPDPELAQQRGGFRLPGGIDVALTVQTQTAINGAVVLASVFRADQGTPTVTAYAPKPGETVAATAPTAAATAAAGAPSITYDSRNGIQVSRAGGPTVALATSGSIAAVPAGLAAVQNGAATDAGTVAQATKNGLSTVTLSAGDLSVTHFAGNAFGSAIANAGSDRAIQTDTTLAIDLRSAGPDVLGSAILRATGLADDAVRGRF